MNATCSSCGTTYRVDPTKIPSGGIRARCTRCDGVFRIAPSTAAPESPAAPAPSVPEAAVTVTPAAEEDTSGEREPAPSPAAPPPRGAPFGVVDPHQQARRLARALVSDIVVYHPDRRERSLEAGTLRADFRDEIRKSWDEYVSRVGEPLAKQTTYFRDALNDILAGGANVF
jgi:predicted Zn finger-like uncharacterized protein